MLTSLRLKRAGNTLVELAVILAVIFILALIAILAYSAFLAKTKTIELSYNLQTQRNSGQLEAIYLTEFLLGNYLSIL